jgi:hypothetical protein
MNGRGVAIKKPSLSDCDVARDTEKVFRLLSGSWQ